MTLSNHVFQSHLSSLSIKEAESVPFVPSTKKKMPIIKRRLFFLFISCYLTLFCVSNIHVSQLILFHHDKTRHLPDLISNPDP